MAPCLSRNNPVLKNGRISINLNFLRVVISAVCCGFVIPAKAGIQMRTFLLDTRLRGCDDHDDSSDTRSLLRDGSSASIALKES